MKYLVTGYRTAYTEVEVEADSAAEAERIAEETIGLPQYWDYFEADEIEDERN